MWHINRTLALENLFQAFQAGKLWLPEQARQLGGRVRDGAGEYYREMTALERVLEQNSSGNWVARYVDHGRADHYAHAELYCYLACFGYPYRPFLRV